MKVLLVITKAEIGGAQTFILTLARGLKKIGVQVAVAAGEGNYLPQELKKEGIPFFYLKNLKRSKNPLKILFYINELKKIINKEGFDAVHFNSTNTLPGIFSVKLSNFKPKTVFTVHGLSVLDSKYKAVKFIKFIFKIYFKFFLNYINNVVFVSKYNFEEAVKYGIADKGRVIYNGLEMPADYFLEKIEAKKSLSHFISKNLEDVYLIGSVGRLAEQKNYDFLIKLWPEIKKIKLNAKLVIIGDGKERKKYEKIIKDLKISEDVFLPGEINNASKFLKSFDLFALPSIYEGLSVSLIEALFSGINILASDVGGNSEIIGIDNCYKLNDEQDFLDKFRNINKVMTDKSLFLADNMVKKYKEIYEWYN